MPPDSLYRGAFEGLSECDISKALDGGDIRAVQSI